MLDGQERHIKCPTAEIIHNDLALTALLVEAIRNSHGGGLVDDAEDLQTHDDAGNDPPGPGLRPVLTGLDRS